MSDNAPPLLNDGSLLQTIPFPVVGIGASAGGLEALTQLLQALPVDTGLAFVIVQHLHPTYPSNLSELLSRVTAMPVSEVTEATPLGPNHVYVIPPNTLMTLSGTTLHLSERLDGRRIHMPIDHFFQSLARELQSQAIGVVLSGTGADGTHGLEALKAEGGISFAQDASAKFEGMPQSAIASGCVDAVMSPRAIAEELARLSKHPYVRPGFKAAAEQAPVVAEGPADAKSVYAMIQRLHGVDFSYYKQTTISRRIQRRMVLHHLDTMDEYCQMLQSQPDECKALFQDLLITVTSFFRDPETFESLKTSVFPALVQDREANAPVRIWVVGCSSGEEAYTIAIELLEFLESQAQSVGIKIFATDVSMAALDKARLGIYPESISADVSPERLRRFFMRVETGYQISKSIRDLCVFARQDVTRDPPFSNMDLVSCRNLLIYFEPMLQRRVLPILHYALADRGHLLLGNSESVGGFSDLFTVVDNKHKLYKRSPGPKRLLFDVSATDSGAIMGMSRPNASPANLSPLDVQREADRVVLNAFAPAGVVVNEILEVVQFRGKTGAYLEPAPGLASLNVLKMAREGLTYELRAALEEAQTSNSRVCRNNILVKTNDHYEETNLEVIPILIPPERSRYFVVLFEPTLQHRQRAPQPPSPQPPKTTAEEEIARLQQELAATRDYQQSLIETLETNNEELKAANEEVISSNEELQSTNEELQTAKEELQATNEELATTNEELQHRNREGQLLTNDLTNLLTSVQIPIVMLGQDLCIRRFTPSAAKALNLIVSDIGRPMSNLKLGFICPDLEKVIVEVIENFSIVEREVQDEKGGHFWLSVRPYRTADNKIDGAVLSLLDITPLKQALEATRQSAAHLRYLTDAIPGMVFELQLSADGSEIGSTISEGASELFGLSREELPNGLAFLWPQIHSADLPRLQAALREPSKTLAEEFRLASADKPVKWLQASARGQRRADGGTVWYGVVTDVTQRKKTEEQLRQSLGEQKVLLREVHHRVKNNLQIISSMMQIQTRMCQDKTVAALFQECQKRVEAMAQLHENLYETGDLRRVDFAAYGRRIAQDLLGMYAGGQQQISLTTNIEPIEMELDTAIPCGLIVNELVSNAVKHAFKGRPSGQVVLSLRRGLPEQLLLGVADNGVGFPTDWENRTPKTLGLHLVQILARQLRGTLTVRRRDDWTEVEVVFKEPRLDQGEKTK